MCQCSTACRTQGSFKSLPRSQLTTIVMGVTDAANPNTLKTRSTQQVPNMRFLAIAAILLQSAAHAGTWTVDDDGPADFAQVTDALASPLVMDGDVLLVEPGNYELLIDARSITIVGMGASPGDVRLKSTSPSVIRNLAANQLVAITNADLGYCHFTLCDGTIALTEVKAGSFSFNGVVNFDRVADCRIENSDITAINIRAQNSNVQFSRSRLAADVIQLGQDAGYPQKSNVHFAQSVARGLDGAAGWEGSYSGEDGADAIDFDRGTLLISGPESLLTGGDGGLGELPNYDGDGGNALEVGCQANVRYSGARLLPGKTPWTLVPSSVMSTCSTAVLEAPALPDPSLERISTVVAGQTLELNTHAVANAFVMTWVGLPQVFAPNPLGIGNQSVTFRAGLARSFVQGTTLPAYFNVPPNAAPGTVLFFQSMAFYPDGTMRFTNSVPAIVR